MQKHLALLVQAVFGSAIVLSLFVASSVFAPSTPYSEEYMERHDGGDRAEYSQEIEHSDPLFYLPPVNETSSEAEANNTLTN